MIFRSKNFESYDKNYPICLDGEGIAPPEDVGGELGYEHFTAAITDKSHPEHDDMSSWARSQNWSEVFNVDLINIALK